MDPRIAELRERLAQALNDQILLRRRAAMAESEIASMIGSPGWHAIEKYRGWLRKQRDHRPTFFRIYEKTLGRALRFASAQPAIMQALKPATARSLPTDTLTQQTVTDDADYQQWIEENEPGAAALDLQRNQPETFFYNPLISIILPVYRVEHRFLRACVESVLNQTYHRWEICLVYAAPEDKQNLIYLRQMAASDARIKLRELDVNGGISQNTNAAMELASGEFVGFLDHDDTLAPFALFSVVNRLNRKPDTDLLYSDHDYLAATNSLRCNPLFKPDWAPEVMLSACYITHFTVVRKALVQDVGGCDPAMDGAQDWDLFLKITNHTPRIEHLAEVLYHWRIHSGSTALTATAGNGAKPYAQNSQLTALKAHMERSGMMAEPVVRADGLLYVRWLAPLTAKVSIIIPTRDKADLLAKCIFTLRQTTRYKNYEILIVDTGSVEAATFHYYDTLKRDATIRIEHFPGSFNYSAVNNYGAQHTTGDLLLFLNNDIEITNETWLEELAAWSLYKPVGVTGAKLLRSDGKIQHAGIVLGLGGFAGHPFEGQEPLTFGLAGSTGWYRNWHAVTGACMMMRREVFEQIGRFDESLILCGSDVEICLRTWKHGYRVVLNPFAELIHHERQTRGDHIPSEDFFVSERYYASFIDEGDEYWSPNLSLWDPRGAFRKRQERTSRDFVDEYLKSLNPRAENIPEGGGLTARAEEHDIVSWFDYNEDDLAALCRLWAATTGYRSVKRLVWFIPAFDFAHYGGIFTILSFADYWRRTKGVKSHFAVCGAGSSTVMAERIAKVYTGCHKSDVTILATLADVSDLPETDACIATLWLTVFYALKYTRTSRHFYFIQDFEPSFYRAGSASAIVSGTYQAGFYGIANTITLRKIYEEHYGGIATHFTPCINPKIFHNRGRKTSGPWKVFVYARPQHPRNSFELAAAALRQLKSRLGNRVHIVTAGAAWKLDDYNLTGVVDHLGLLAYEDTADLYRSCDVGVVLMFTKHPSYLPFELMATGCMVVTNANHWNTWFLKDEVNCLVARPTAGCLADAIERGLTNTELRHSITAYAAEDIRRNYSDWGREMEHVHDFLCDPCAGSPSSGQ